MSAKSTLVTIGLFMLVLGQKQPPDFFIKIKLKASRAMKGEGPEDTR